MVDPVKTCLFSVYFAIGLVLPSGLRGDVPHKRFHFPSLVAVQNLLALHHTIWRGTSKIGVPVAPPLLGRGVVSPRLLNLVVFAHTV